MDKQKNSPYASSNRGVKTNTQQQGHYNIPVDQNQFTVEAMEILTEQGFKFFPCSDNKHPAIPKKESWKDPKYHKPWGKCGKMVGAVIPENIFILDLDCNHGDKADGVVLWEKKIRPAYQIPDNLENQTLTVRTRAGGIHLYFYYNGSEELQNHPLKLSDVKQKDDLDIIELKKPGSYIMATCSVGYAALNDFEPMELPESLLMFLKQPEYKEIKNIDPTITNTAEDLKRVLSEMPVKEFQSNALWENFIMAARSYAGNGDDVTAALLEWSSSDPKYSDDKTLYTRIKSFKSWKKPGDVSKGTFFYICKQHGIVAPGMKKKTKIIDKLQDFSIHDEKKPAKPHGIPEIHAGSQDLAALSASGWEALKLSNKPERLFTRAGLPVRMTQEGDLQSLTTDRLLHEEERAAWWYHLGTGRAAGQKIKAKPPRIVCVDMLAYPEIPLPVLKKIVKAPCYNSDGILCDTPGFHSGGIYIKDIPLLPKLPTKEDAIKTLDDIFCDFIFESPADRANTFAFLLLPFVRDLIPGQTPATEVEAATAGTGKGLLIDVCSRISIGGEAIKVTPTSDENEMRKRLTSILMQAKEMMVLDNVEDLSGSTLSGFLTASEWTDRRLGANETITIINRIICAITGNNIIISTEMARRIMRIRLVSPIDQPWTRSGFKHPHLLQYVSDNLPALQAACISIIKSWLDAGRPAGVDMPFGSFESFSSVMSGILTYAGINGFMENRNLIFEQADIIGSAWREFVEEWWTKFSNSPVGVKELFPIALDIEGISLPQKTNKSQKTAFGMMLSKNQDRIFGEYKIVYAGKANRLKQYKLEINVPYVPLVDSQSNGRNKNPNSSIAEKVHKGNEGTLNNEELDIF